MSTSRTLRYLLKVGSLSAVGALWGMGLIYYAAGTPTAEERTIFALFGVMMSGGAMLLRDSCNNRGSSTFSPVNINDEPAQPEVALMVEPVIAHHQPPQDMDSPLNNNLRAAYAA